MALKNTYVDEAQDITISDAYYRISGFVVRENDCDFWLDCWKSRAKSQAGGKKLAERVRLYKYDVTGRPLPLLIDKSESRSIWKIIYDYIKTIPGWETATDAQD